MTVSDHHPPVLTIAGSDSGGGAGIQADLKTIAMCGGYGMSVITALTAQNGLGVTGIHAPDPGFVALQLTTVLEGFTPAAAKTGMLFSADIIHALAPILAEARIPLVVDPVCVSQSGHSLLQNDAVEAMKTAIIPLATLLTPNRPEAELLTGLTLRTADDAQPVLDKLLEMGAGAVLLKGGHFEGDEMVDWLALPGGAPLALAHERVQTGNNHGTGCTLSAAIATFLARGLDMEAAIRAATDYLLLGLRTSYAPGKGAGPVNHSAPLDAARGRL